DVAGRRLVAMSDHRCKRRRFAGPGSADDKNEPAFFHYKVAQKRRELQFRQRRNLGADDARHKARPLALTEQVKTETADTVDDLGHVELAGSGEFLAL